MHDQSPALLWLMRCSFVLLALLILFFQLLPLDTAPRRWAGPDLLLAFAVAWCLRRPEFVPALVLAGIFLLADLLLQRPPGLWAVLALVMCERLKHRGRGLRDATFPAEWLAVALNLAGLTVAYHLLHMLFFLPVPPLRLNISMLLATLVCYPIVVAITHGLMHVRKVAPGDLDAYGQRA
ncbi:MAG: rod shape-determining protein MreD [Sulfitobacter sp.]